MGIPMSLSSRWKVASRYGLPGIRVSIMFGAFRPMARAYFLLHSARCSPIDTHNYLPCPSRVGFRPSLKSQMPFMLPTHPTENLWLTRPSPMRSANGNIIAVARSPSSGCFLLPINRWWRFHNRREVAMMQGHSGSVAKYISEVIEMVNLICTPMMSLRKK